MGAKDKSEIIRFVDIYINNGFNGKAAMKEAFPNITQDSQEVKLSRWIHSDDVMECMLARVKSLNLTTEKLKNYFHKVLLMIADGKKTSASDKIKAIDMMARLNTMLKNHIQVDNLNIDKEDTDLYNKYINRRTIPILDTDSPIRGVQDN